jgi:hypothetical protein
MILFIFFIHFMNMLNKLNVIDGFCLSILLHLILMEMI